MLLLAGCSADGAGVSGGRTDGAARARAHSPYWVNPHGSAARQAEKYRAAGRDAEAELIEKIASRPVAEWIGPEDPAAETRRLTRAAERADRRALLVLYNLPHRDCGQYSQGGAPDGDAYRAWVDAVVRGIGDRAATVVVEPDALPHLLQEGCTPRHLHGERYTLLHEAVTRLAGLPGTRVYLDAGNPDWVRDPGALVEPLRRAGIGAADGFALNVSNFQTTASNIAYGRKLSAMLGGKHFVVDTSRNGNGPAAGRTEESWCNPPGRALGEPPTTRTGRRLVDAFLWIKRPGESDGPCKGGPEAGEWYPEYALTLARNADF
ncbi:glycoside hydrolase family 6 protein [Streptomyces sp. JJ36]|uniref:glycoside hydrolase family 6 protein n=1 Tax=Streptomyces sp. JJ36 TaxID=2736645 RepID=UPI0027E45FA1|nr:glycoside hydrolase family 6 protein [Streptomyces sp. JJ36]MCF6525982.1 glycoside hydrolase family 6 protein [Streptomyces sp. JJ36]